MLHSLGSITFGFETSEISPMHKIHGQSFIFFCLCNVEYDMQNTLIQMFSARDYAMSLMYTRVSFLYCFYQIGIENKVENEFFFAFLCCWYNQFACRGFHL